MKELNFIQADNADFNYGSAGVLANLSKKQWHKFHEKHEDSYLFSMFPEDHVYFSFHHYYAINGIVVQVSVRGIEEGKKFDIMEEISK
jgi:hypothetical protein